MTNTEWSSISEEEAADILTNGSIESSNDLGFAIFHRVRHEGSTAVELMASVVGCAIRSI